jgi:hypothetical protein
VVHVNEAQTGNATASQRFCGPRTNPTNAHHNHMRLPYTPGTRDAIKALQTTETASAFIVQ